MFIEALRKRRAKMLSNASKCPRESYCVVMSSPAQLGRNPKSSAVPGAAAPVWDLANWSCPGTCTGVPDSLCDTVWYSVSAWGATAGFTDDWAYEGAYERYVGDEAMAARLTASNPEAMRRWRWAVRRRASGMASPRQARRACSASRWR